MGRSPCCSKEGLNRGAWTATEDQILKDYITTHGEGKWKNIPKLAGLKRCGKSCRLRWLNYLRPDIKRGNLSEDEEDLIVRLHKLLGNRWSLIAGRLPGRTDNEIKNYWNTKLSKKTRPKPSKNSKNIEKESVMTGTQSGQCNDHPVGVIRTKAVRCSQRLQVTPQLLRQHQKTLVLETSSSMDHEKLMHFIGSESNGVDGSFSFLANEIDNSSSGYMMDFDVGGISISEILDSDFDNTYSNVIEGATTTTTGNDHEICNNIQAFLVNEEFLDNWNGGDTDIDEANLDLDFGSSIPFLESTEEWII